MATFAIPVAFFIGLSIGLLLILFVRHRNGLEVQDQSDHKQAKMIDQTQAKAQQILPLLPNFPYNISDVCFLGNPIQYIIFDGYTEVKDTDITEIRKIVFVGVKQNTASLTKVQQSIRKAIEAGNIQWEDMQVEGDMIIGSSSDLISEISAEIPLHRRAYLLGESDSLEAIPELIQLASHKNGNVRRLAASGLGKLGSKKPQIFQAVPTLIGLLSDSKPQVRQYATKALGEIGDKRALTAVSRLVDDPIYYVANAAKIVLRKLNAR